MTSPASDWFAHNQRLLLVQLARILGLLERHAGSDAASPTSDPCEGMPMDEDDPPALRALCEAFGLSSFERDVLLLCAGVELDSTLATQCAAAQRIRGARQPTFGLALAALPQPEWAALCPSGPLRHHHLIELSGGAGPCRSALRISERILHYLVGISCLDERLRGLFTPVPEPLDLPPSHRAAALQIAALWSPGSAGPRGAAPVLQLSGADARDGRAIAATACTALGLGLHAVRAADLPPGPGDRDALRALWQREARLERSAAVVCFDEHDGPETQRAARAFIEDAQGLLMVMSREPIRLARPDVVRFSFHPPTMAEQRSLWLEALGPLAAGVNGQLDRIVSHFTLPRPAIQAAVTRSLAASEEALGSALWEACREEARPQLDDLAQRIEPRAGWDDLVLPAVRKHTLREIVAQQRQRATVYEAWGFADRSTRGLGTTALFCGPSGTGKTMAAEVLACELGLDVYRIDLSQVVSKYIGETEKNLRRVFDAAENGSAILLFDEADALFGKRSDVKDSHDRYANIEVSYLLQRMEAYRGLAILTTNMRRALDSAFLRRIRFVIEFPFPAEEQRAELWSRAFPAATPTEGLDVDRLARLPIAGGSIRNIALNAAFLAADAGSPVRMRHLAAAARSEFAKLEKALDERDVGAWS